MNENTLEHLIGSLTDQYKPLKPLAHPLGRLGVWLGVAIVYMFCVGALHGYRGDIAVQLRDSAFLFEILAMTLIGLSAAMASLWLCVPDMRGQGWMMAVPFTAFGCFVLWTISRLIAQGAIGDLVANAGGCAQLGLLMGFVPTAFLIFMVRKGATTRPVMMGVMNILAVTGFSYVCLRLACPIDHLAHATLFHISPFVLAGAGLGFAARRIYHW